MLDATYDYPDSNCFIQFDVYSLKYLPTTDVRSPISEGIAMVDTSGYFRGWIREDSRAAVDIWLRQGVNMQLRVVKYSRRWTEYDSIIQRTRRFRDGEAQWETVTITAS